MADDNEKVPAYNKAKVTELQNNVQASIDKLQTDVMASNPELSHTNSYLRSQMHKNIDAIINNNISNTGLSNISMLYGRAYGKDLQKDNQVIDSIIKTFEDDSVMNNVMSLYSQNTYLKEFDREVDTVCKYMPKLLEALATRKESVLAADHFTQDCINIKSTSSELSEVATENNIKAMKEKYNLSDFLDRVFSETDKLGETFVYCVPYEKALSRILKKSPRNVSVSGEQIVSESMQFSIDENTHKLVEHVNPTREYIKENGGLTVELNTSGVLESVINYHTNIGDIFDKAPESINEDYSSGFKRIADTIADGGKPIKKSLYKIDSFASDGLVDTHKKKIDTKVKVPGCVLKILDHTMVKPLYIEDTCLGYYYIECDNELNMNQLTFSSTLGGLKPGHTARKLSANSAAHQDKQILRKIASKISQKIDAKFINANQDLTKEIYLILKYNMDANKDGKISKIRVTFIPPEDIIHTYFKKDPDSNRGVSSLQKALFPAKLFSCLYISNVVSILTRGNDKRVYYVRQNVDTNISAVLLNTISQIKKSNFGLRQIENMNNIMNITGRFNDYVIPESANGDAPVRFEIMEGQKVEVQTELMDKLEEMAINSTDVPMEVITARQQLDFATQYTMSNTRFLRTVYNLQSKTKKFFDKILTRIYDAEFQCDDSVEVELPPPMYLNLMNFTQIQAQTRDTVEFVAPLYIDVENSDPRLVSKVKAGITKFYLKSFLPDDAIKKIVDKCEMEFAKEKDPGEAEQAGPGGGGMQQY